MKKFIYIFAIALAFAGSAYAQSFPNTNVLTTTGQINIYDPNYSSISPNGKMRSFTPPSILRSATAAGSALEAPSQDVIAFYDFSAGIWTALNLGTNLSITGTTINAASSGGTVSSVSATDSNGFDFTVSNPTTTPSISLAVTPTGVLKASAGAISAATAGTDYVSPSTATTYTAQQNFGSGTLTDAASIAWNLNIAQAAKVVLTTGVGPTRVLANPTNMVDGGTYILKITQSASGSNALTYGSAYKWPSGTAPTLSTGANAVDILTFVSDGTNMYGVATKQFQ